MSAAEAQKEPRAGLRPRGREEDLGANRVRDPPARAEAPGHAHERGAAPDHPGQRPRVRADRRAAPRIP